MAADARAEQGEAESKEGKKEKKRKPVILFIIIGVVLLLILGTAAFFIFFGGGLPFLGSDDTDAHEEVAAPPRFTYPMAEFQVNLYDPVARRFLRMKIDLAYDEKALNKEIETRESELRSSIIEVLRSKTVDDLDEPGGMKALEEDLLEVVNNVLLEGEVRAIYYKEFIFQ